MDFTNIKIDDLNINLPLSSTNLLVGQSSVGKTNFCEKLCGLVPSKILINDYVIDNFQNIKYFSNDYLFLSNSIIEEISSEYINMFDINKNPNNLLLFDKIKLFILSEEDSESEIVVFDNIYDLIDFNNKIKFHNLINKYIPNKTILITSNNLSNCNLFDNIYLLNDNITNINDIYINRDLIESNRLELPFILNLSNKLSYYNLIDKPYENIDQMVGDLWK